MLQDAHKGSNDSVVDIGGLLLHSDDTAQLLASAVQSSTRISRGRIDPDASSRVSNVSDVGADVAQFERGLGR